MRIMSEETPNPDMRDREVARSLAQTIRLALMRLTGARAGEESVREVLEEMIDEKSSENATPVESQERMLLANVLSLRERTVADVMVPRADIVAIDVSATVADLVSLFGREEHSRIPVYQGNLDNAIGMVHIKDIIVAQSKGTINARLGSMVRDVLFVAPSMHVLELLLEMRFKRIHMALVVDEFGGVDGLLTIEDLVEEIVGDIDDEYDEDTEPLLVHRPDGALDADARVDLETFESVVGSILNDAERAEIDTLGGLVFDLLGRVPIRGELVKHPSGMEIEILEADPRRVRRLRVRGVDVDETKLPTH
jgi:CBS domain containing-hemolysin-like protein